MNNLENNSGEGKNSVVLDIVAKRFNWGAFWFTWIWGLFNKSYWTLVILGLGILGFILCLFLHTNICVLHYTRFLFALCWQTFAQRHHGMIIYLQKKA